MHESTKARKTQKHKNNKSRKQEIKGNIKCEIRNKKLETREIPQFPVSSFR